MLFLRRLRFLDVFQEFLYLGRLVLRPICGSIQISRWIQKLFGKILQLSFFIHSICHLLPFKNNLLQLIFSLLRFFWLLISLLRALPWKVPVNRALIIYLIQGCVGIITLGLLILLLFFTYLFIHWRLRVFHFWHWLLLHGSVGAYRWLV